MAEIEEELKSLLMMVKEESEKADLKLAIKKQRSWHTVPSLHDRSMGKQQKQWQTIFVGSKNNGQWLRHENKNCLLLGRKAMTNLDSVLKSRDVALPTKVHTFKAMVFPSSHVKCESWTIRKAQHQKMDTFKLRCWRRLLKVPWIARRPSQSILEEINPEYSLEGLMLKLKLECFGHLMWRTNSLEKTLMLGKIKGGRRKGW